MAGNVLNFHNSWVVLSTSFSFSLFFLCPSLSSAFDVCLAQTHTHKHKAEEESQKWEKQGAGIKKNLRSALRF